MVGVVPELTERPGAEHFTESWLRQVDSGVWMLFKTGSERCFEFADLAVVSAMILTNAATVDAYAGTTASGAARWAVRKPSWIWRARWLR